MLGEVSRRSVLIGGAVVGLATACSPNKGNDPDWVELSEGDLMFSRPERYRELPGNDLFPKVYGRDGEQLSAVGTFKNFHEPTTVFDWLDTVMRANDVAGYRAIGWRVPKKSVQKADKTILGSWTFTKNKEKRYGYWIIASRDGNTCVVELRLTKDNPQFVDTVISKMSLGSR